MKNVKNRMGVPEEYEPVLPEKIKAHIEKKKAQKTEAAEEKERQDMQKCYEAIKKAREIRYAPQHKYRRSTGASHTHIPMAMWEVLQEVIEVTDEREKETID